MIKLIGAKVVDSYHAFYIGGSTKKSYLSSYFWCDSKNAIGGKRATNVYMTPELTKTWY